MAHISCYPSRVKSSIDIHAKHKQVCVLYSCNLCSFKLIFTNDSCILVDDSFDILELGLPSDPDRRLHSSNGSYHFKDQGMEMVYYVFIIENSVIQRLMI